MAGRCGGAGPLAVLVAAVLAAIGGGTLAAVLTGRPGLARGLGWAAAGLLILSGIAGLVRVERRRDGPRS